MRRSLHATILAALALALAAPALAQRTTGGISGTVKDAIGRRPARRHGLGERPQHRRDADGGDQRAGLLPVHQPAARRVPARASASPASRPSPGAACAWRSGGTIEENAALEVSQLQESVEVVGESSVVDTTSNEVGSNFGREWVENAPLRRFSFFDLVAAAPGSLQGGDATNASAAPWSTAPPTTRTPSRWTASTSRTTTSTRRSPSPTWTRSRRSRSSRWAPRPSTAT